KVLRPEVSVALGRERFLREIEVAARLTHPGILSLHDSGEANGLLFFVMPFVEGHSLRTRLEEGPLPSVDEAMRITHEIGEALAYAHGQGLVHRDIKPENILLHAGHAVVCDFGIAQAATKAGDRLTRTGVAIGTFTYMSPEQLDGQGEVDERTDIYALGCLLTEMLIGEAPFEAGTPHASLARKLTGKNPDVSASRPEVPRTVQAVLERALEVQPENRFETTEAFIQALETATSVAAVEADTLWRNRRRRTRLATQAAGVALLALTAWWMSTMGGGPSMERIAVLPLEGLEGDTAQAYLAPGIHRDLVLELSRAGLRVIAPASMARYAGTDMTVREIAEELQVDGVITAKASIGGSAVDLLLTLVDASDELVWSEDFREAPRNIQILYRKATRAVAARIGFHLSDEAQARLASTQVVDPQVYYALLTARFHWQKLTAEGIETAEEYYRLAVERDSTCAEGWWGLGNMWGARAQMGLISPQEAREKATPFREKAQALDPDLFTILAQFATTSAWSNWDWDGSRRAFVEALDADPTDSTLRSYYAHLLLYMGQKEEALEEARRAAEMDPFNTLVQGLYGMTLNFLYRSEESEAVLLQALGRDPEAPILLSTLRTTYHLLGRHEEAIRMWQASYGSRGDTEALDALNRGYASGGYAAALRAVAQLFETRTEPAYVPSWQIGTLYTRAGDLEPALAYLEKAFIERDGNIPSISVDPIFDDLRANPRFQAMVDSLRLPN
ncbi:MAG: protein kinase, partial [Longimicrobiales bacterium]|nr:protein kinase [Longimicrobiales bacterium]